MIDLYNTVLAGLSTPRKAFQAYEKTPSGEYARKFLQQNLLEAKRFVLDDNLVEEVVNASFCPPSDLLQAIQTSQLPAEYVWFELNEKKRVATILERYEEHGVPVSDDLSETARNVGYLCSPASSYMNFHSHISSTTRVDDIDSSIFELFTFDEENKKILQCPFNYALFPTQEFTYNDYKAIKQREGTDAGWDRDQFVMQSHKFACTLFGQGYYKIHKDKRALQKLNTRCAGGYSVFLSMMHDMSTPQKRQEVANHYNSEQSYEQLMSIIQGDGRFMATLLSFINYPNLIQTTNKIKNPHSRIRWGKTLPRNELTVMEIELPKRRGKNIYHKIFAGSGKPKRRHYRLGHWNHYWINGEKVRKYIKGRWVGDASNGIIQHDYSLIGKGRHDQYSK